MMTTPETIPELKPAAQLAAEMKASLASDEDARDAKEFSFSIRHTYPRGKMWAGDFVNHILSIGADRRVKVLKAQMAGGLPVSALDGDLWDMNDMVAHMSVSLVKRPKWAEDFEALFDRDLVRAIYAEVASHEARFHRREAPTAAGTEAAD